MELIEAVAAVLDLDSETINTSLKAGKTLLEIAEDEGLDEDDFLDQLADEVSDWIAEQVTAGKMTQTQASTLEASLEATLEKMVENEMMGGQGGGGQQGDMGYNLIELAADILSIEQDTLAASLKEGKTLAEAAEDAGMDEDDFLEALVDAATAAIEAAEDAGSLTAAQAEQALSNLSGRLEEQIQQEMKAGEPPANNGTQGAGTASKPATTTQATTTSSSSSASGLTDMKNHWAAAYVEDLVSRGIITGDSNKKFNPSSSVTKEQLATMVAKSFNQNISTDSTASKQNFSDVATDRWSYAYIEATKDYFEAGTSFNPTEESTREDVVVTLIKSLLAADTSLSLPSDSEALELLESKLTDADSIASSARAYVALAIEKGLVSGDTNGNFSPAKTVTRAEIAKMLDVLIKSLEAAES
ncbi:Endoglucanase precursor [compost metagenome]